VGNFGQKAGGRIVVFGSLVEGGFDTTSDLDVAVFGIPPDEDEEIAMQIDMLLREAGFEADVIPERFLPPSLKERMLSYGQEQRTLGGRSSRP
jgi:predicted nucleotidyltransferase